LQPPAGLLCQVRDPFHGVYFPAEQASGRLQRLGYSNVHPHVVDGTEGLACHAPFAAILVPAAAREVPQPLLAQLAEGGRLVIPIGGREQGQRMMRYVRHGETFSCDDLGPFAFVPLIGEHGFREVR
jgi:protein-L-isoaspartate(D-aspartate) O-methyltransferase